MQRREFIKVLGVTAVSWPLAANAQKPAMPVVGYLESGNATSPTYPTAAFHAGLKESGFVEGQNVTIEYRMAETQYDRLPALLADLISRKAVVIVASGAVVSPLAAQTATTTIPIVFFIGADPVRNGLVASLNRPGGNITGVTLFGGELGRKQLEMLRELMPKARAIAVLLNPKNPSHAPLLSKIAWQPFADTIGVPIETVSASSESDFEPAIASLADKQVDAVYVAADTLFGSYRESLIAVLARHAMPAMFPSRQNVVAGGLICYGASNADAQHQVGIYAGRILRGEKPADLPVVQPTKFEMVINLKTAKALGITVPDSLLVQATEVIE
jgi:putative tryptophan/tyrosine transport system substrate-binding protein